MALIQTTPLLKIADRLAYQYGQLKTACTTIQAQGTGYYWETVTATGDKDVEVPTLALYGLTDNDLAVGRMAAMGTYLGNIIAGMECHFSGTYPGGGTVLQNGGWDGYLTTYNKRVSQYFAEFFYAYHGFYMMANNVFSEGDDQFAALNVSAGPVLNYTAGINYGTGSVLNPANGTYFAATQLKVKVVTMGASNLSIRLSVKDINNNPTTIDVTIPAGSVSGAIVNVGSSSDRFLACIGAIYVPAGSTGTVGDSVTVRNLKERQIAL